MGTTVFHLLLGCGAEEPVSRGCVTQEVEFCGSRLLRDGSIQDRLVDMGSQLENDGGADVGVPGYSVTTPSPKRSLMGSSADTRTRVGRHNLDPEIHRDAWHVTGRAAPGLWPEGSWR